MSVFTILKNNFYRIISKKAIIINTIIFVPLMIMAAVYFTDKMEIKGTIAVVSENKFVNLNTKYLKVKVLDKKPKMSELLLNKYDAVLEDKGNGKIQITTIKGDKFKNTIENYLKAPQNINANLDIGEKRGVGTNILGFLIMIILVQSVALMILYPEDRDFKTFRRILISPVSEGKYLLAQGIFNFIIIYISVFLAIVIAKVVFNVNIGFSYGNLAILLSIITFLGTAFALFITSAIDDLESSLMLGSVIITLTSILSGSFYSFSDNNKILDTIINILPQKSYLTLVQGVENGKNILSYKLELSYIVILILVLFTLASLMTKNSFKTGKY
ncbi:ABC-2 family transporter protein [Clostridium sporogenes]|uniref:ABC transporter permease n=1 Tax=Clostridium botulinum TaxID=1491 RepID=UPI0007178429|nr:ABC transporter permease [Clostridium botulinum]KRU30348.1 ABC-2 family transporter protein [Clostridium sporogenes]KRU30732.1 ABC-2 family transporter protein [Clostridium sporogenes]KRU34842.1 ABC-2 family transporter protein [Clostridium sporogenes]KRU43050.1 ABC-2 family transporter protein [Clostridium sporogenes]MBZ1330656.1 ABC transporter permease [Clostridium botulinum]